MGLTRRDLLQAGASLLVAPAVGRLAKFAPSSFRFAFFSDTHVAVGRNIKENAEMLAEISALNPDFAINGGDVTDQGWRTQIDLYKGLIKELAFPVHHCPGNHDVRWSPLGMQIFEEHFGKPYRAFEHKGCWFIILNTTVPLSHWGNIASPQLTWLKGVLKKIGPRTPIFLFGHHWIGRETPDTSRPVVQVDNEYDVIALLRGRNVTFIGNGHGHSDIEWEAEGTYALMNKGLYQLSYTILDVDVATSQIKVYRRTAERPILTLVRTIPLQQPKALEKWEPDKDAAMFGEQVRVNESVWAPRGAVKFAALATIPGVHEAYFRRIGTRESRRKTFRKEEGAIKKVWDVPLSGGVMSHICHSNGELFVSGMDGSVACFDAISGKRKWQAVTGGYCHSSPMATDSDVLVGSADGHLYCFNRRSGKARWKLRLPGPVYASPTVAKGIVFIANAGKFFGVDLSTGKVRWIREMPKSETNFAQSRAATDGEAFVQGCWDSHLYALEAETGEIRWRNACQERTFAFSPAIGSPVIEQGSVYIVANGNGLFRFDLATGKKVWEIASPGQKYGHSGPCVVGDRVFAGNLGDGEGEVRCVSKQDGTQLWVAKTGYTIYDSCVRSGPDFVVVNSVPGVVNVLAQDTGKLIGQYRLGAGHSLGTVAVEGRQIYCASFSNRLFCLKV